MAQGCKVSPWGALSLAFVPSPIGDSSCNGPGQPKCGTDSSKPICGENNSCSEGRAKNPPDKGPPNGYVEGPRRGREYGPDGAPVRDYDNPHQGADYPHVHEWPNGEREEPGRPYSPIPK